ncbi:MAG: helix-turn-helix transcriptional regulator [Bifidobacteriaceae bacterium]|jgi:DNA-binding CsgD family transcriptional regulator|nr:helix-turn-helix transcriptional regulator [Bifidobacteriaceae bacterium]
MKYPVWAQGARASDAHGFDYLTTILGFGLCRAWIVLCLGSLMTGHLGPLEGIWLIDGAASSLIAVFASKAGNSPERVRLVAFRVTAALVAVMAPVFALSALVGNRDLYLVAYFASGAAAGGLQVLWGGRFAAWPVGFSAICAPAAAIVTALVLVLVSDTATTLAIVLFPLVSLALVLADGRSRIGADQAAWPTEEPAPALGRRYGRDTAKLMVSILVFSLICRLYDTVPLAAPDPFEFLGSGTLTGMIVVGAVFLALFLASQGRFNAVIAYRLSLPVMVTGLTVAAAFFSQHGAVCLLLINLGYELFDILSWILFAQIARRTGKPLRVFGLGTAFTFTGMGLAYLVGPPLYDRLAPSGSQFLGFALLSITVLVVVLFLVIPESALLRLAGVWSGRGEPAKVGARSGPTNLEAGAGADAVSSPTATPATGAAAHAASDAVACRAADVAASPAAGPGAGAAASSAAGTPTLDELVADRCAKIAAAFALTAREQEVLAFLARGRTLQIVARDLQIAQGTARTHIQNIYAKLGVHKQQELIDRVDDFEHS